MPIANCIFAPHCPEGQGDIIELWSVYAGKSSDEMTVNMIASNKQAGKQYSVVASLYLPSIWSEEDINALQTGLARALAEYWRVDSAAVLVMVHILASGRVVESGETLVW
ncbi:hypothetical protein QWI17_12055 [Gilvimarinus sp. SDUM040013]|uniref:Uncharacterized protein n=1 Tax=Gilvimarinus gilvus TaxID=3058038 RepID=A0ABU4RYA7_9GAMM|nr:hypothetical protein [Gilvimarinus sp. SDUM040013]MDO3386570.1 hypothetical protein [Gilvimarinus sp. SDUM040013]MDX6849146.1 hypothetical protein [Gilvimarinus sp. SDUM040013]